MLWNGVFSDCFSLCMSFDHWSTVFHLIRCIYIRQACLLYCDVYLVCVVRANCLSYLPGTERPTIDYLSGYFLFRYEIQCCEVFCNSYWQLFQLSVFFIFISSHCNWFKVLEYSSVCANVRLWKVSFIPLSVYGGYMNENETSPQSAICSQLQPPYLDQFNVCSVHWLDAVLFKLSVTVTEMAK